MSIKGSLRVPSAAAMALAAASSDDEEYGSDYDASTERGQDGEIEDQEDLETKAQDEQDVAKSVKLSNAIAKILSGGTGEEGQLIPKKRKSKASTQPILALNRSLERSLDSHKLEAKARRLLTAEKKKLSEAGRTIPDVTVGADHEKTLRKTATRGVVQLFNAIKAAQKTLERVQSDGIQKHIEEAPQLAKASFLEKMLGSSVPLADDAPVLGSNKKQKRESTEVEAGHKEEEEEESGPAWLKGDFLTGSANKKDATGWDQIAEEEEEEGEEIL